MKTEPNDDEPPKEIQHDMEGSLWRVVLKRLRAREDFGYGMKVDYEWLEKELAAERDTNDFTFAVLKIKMEIEEEDGYYLESRTTRDEESGKTEQVYQIPSAAEHQAVADKFDSKTRNYARRANDILVATLNNPAAQLKSDERKRMEHCQYIAATRIALIRREEKIAELVREHAPKLLP